MHFLVESSACSRRVAVLSKAKNYGVSDDRRRTKITLPYLFNKVHNHEPITWLTCYDYPTAYLQEQAGMDMILVGDSLAMTMLGYETTLPATMDDMIRHSGRSPWRAQRLHRRRHALYELPAQRRVGHPQCRALYGRSRLRLDQAGRRR